MVLSLTTVHENDAVIPLLAKEGPGVVDCWAATPYPLLLQRRGAIFMAGKNPLVQAPLSGSINSGLALRALPRSS
jgi:hypothetical protein